jgi:hypothetical protein
LRHLDQNRPPYTVWKCVRDVETLSRKATIALAWSFIVRCHSTPHHCSHAARIVDVGI